MIFLYIITLIQLLSFMNKCTLLIDCNWLTQSRLPIFMDSFEMSNPEHVKLQAQNDLKDLMAKSINILLNRFDVIDNIVMVGDGGSWRKQLHVPESLNAIYKGNRETDSKVDWKYVWNSLNSLFDTAKELGVTVTQYNNVEGDDWIWYWSRKLNNEGSSCIIWSSDNDLKQLVQKENNAFTAWYNDRNGLFLPDSLNDELDDIDFFMKLEYNSPILDNLKLKSKSTNYINPDDIIMQKIICGDAGDNIKSVFRYTKNNRVYRVTEKIWEGIKSELNISDFNDFRNRTNYIVSSICNHSKFMQYNPNKEHIAEMIDYNIKLVWLNEVVIPETVIESMNQQEYKEFDINYIKSNYKALVGEDEVIKQIFEHEL